MSKRIRITSGAVEKIAILNNSPMAEALVEALPIEASASRWGDEIYFAVPLKPTAGEKKTVVDKGDIAFWPPGRAFCIFFGPTPVSKGAEIRPASEVILLGKIESDPEGFKNIKDRDPVRIEEA
ncbi:MAG: cyclophilin-like fold protein [bacterium]